MAKNSSDSSWGVGNIVAALILAAILITGGTLLGNSVRARQAQKAVAGSSAFSFEPVVEKTVSYAGQDGKSALELLKANHEISSQDSSIGVFVTAIDGTANQDNKYWMFYVNDTLATTGADQYISKNTDKIDWRYESLQ